MMNIPIRLRTALLAAIVIFFVIVLYFLKKRRFTLKYSLLWLLTGMVMLVLVAFPELMMLLSGIIGTQSVMNTLYLLILGFVLILLMMLTSIVSGQTERIRSLAQSNALLEKRIRELETVVQDSALASEQPETDLFQKKGKKKE